MGPTSNHPCGDCPHLAKALARIAELEALVRQQAGRIAELELQLAKATRTSATSSKPPSSDIISPPTPARRGRRHIGAQKGHPLHRRTPLAPDEIIEHRLKRCPRCGGLVDPLPDPPAVRQQVEVVEHPVRVTEHRRLHYYCRRCQRPVEASWPDALRHEGLFGPRLTALCTWLKGSAHASYSTIQTLLGDAFCLPVSRGYLAKALIQSSKALAPAYETLLAALQASDHLNIDETGHKECGRSLWTWVFRAREFTVYRIAPSRGSEVLESVLGQTFAGTLSCDYFSAYRKFIGVHALIAQFCLAHLIREVRFLAELPDRATARYGRRLLAILRQFFRLLTRRPRLQSASFERRLAQLREQFLAVGRRAPAREGARQLGERLRRDGRAYFTFLTTPGMEPTNNLAERALRFVVIDRRLTQGTRGTPGRRLCERLWSARATCLQQGRSFFHFLYETLQAHAHGETPPSLLPSGP